MMIIGCDLHTRYQQIAMLDTETVELEYSRAGSQRVNIVITQFLLRREAKRKNFRWADLVQRT
jgi:hypothetical protein